MTEEKKSGEQPEPTSEEQQCAAMRAAEDRLTAAFKAGAEKERKEVGAILSRCDVLAKHVKRLKDTTPSLNFPARLKTMEVAREIQDEYENLKMDVIARTGKIASYQDTGEQFIKVVNAHLRVLDSCFGLDDDFGFKVE